jgi:pyrroline-5-carboxylate reductase
MYMNTSKRGAIGAGRLGSAMIQAAYEAKILQGTARNISQPRHVAAQPTKKGPVLSASQKNRSALAAALSAVLATPPKTNAVIPRTTAQNRAALSKLLAS